MTILEDKVNNNVNQREEKKNIVRFLFSFFVFESLVDEKEEERKKKESICITMRILPMERTYHNH
jgi:hypothetical protein